MPKGTRRPFTHKDMSVGRIMKGGGTWNSDRKKKHSEDRDKKDKKEIKTGGAKKHNRNNQPGVERRREGSLVGRTTGDGGPYPLSAGTRKAGQKATAAKSNRARNIRNSKNAPTKRKVRTGVSNGKRGSTKR